MHPACRSCTKRQAGRLSSESGKLPNIHYQQSHLRRRDQDTTGRRFDIKPQPSNIQHPMRILMISAEGPPLQRAGALVDVLDALPHELRERGHEVSLVLPFYRELRENKRIEAKDTGVTVDIRVGDKNHVAEYFESRTSTGVQFFSVRCDEFYDRPVIYGENGTHYDDNAARFIFFNRAAIA